MISDAGNVCHLFLTYDIDSGERIHYALTAKKHKCCSWKIVSLKYVNYSIMGYHPFERFNQQDVPVVLRRST